MRYILDFIDTAQQEQIDVYMTENQCQIVQVYDAVGKVYLVDSPSDPMSTEIISFIRQDGAIPVSLDSMTVNIPITEQNWWKIVSYAERDIEPDEVSIDVEINEAFHDVYVIDSGIDVNHPEFSGQNINNLYTSFDGDYNDQLGHGTAVASLITGNTCAMSRANIHNVKIVSDTTDILLSTLIESLNQVKSHSDSRPDIPAIANFSWIIDYDEFVNQKIQALIDSGIACVASAGNQGVPVTEITPACIPDVFTVGSYTEDFVPADFSNYTAEGASGKTNHGQLDIWAPGTNIKIATLGDAYTISQGTSFSAAIVSASIAYNANRMESAFSEFFNNVYYKEILSPRLYSQILGAREQLLSLENEYAFSNNSIASFMSYAGSRRARWDRQKGNYDLLTFIHDNRFRNFFFMFIAPESDIQSFNITGNFPSGAQLYKGWLCVDFSSFELPENTTYEQFLFTIEITSPDSTVTTLDTDLLYTQDQHVTIDDPDTDEAIKIRLQAPCFPDPTVACRGNCSEQDPAEPTFACEPMGTPKTGGDCICIP